MIREILNYTIIRKIGEGGMGQVFLAKNKSINQYVAIKMLNPRFSNNPVLRERFRQEAIMLSSLSHPNIVKFLNFVENEYGVFLIMEYVEGMTLEDYLNHKTGLLIEQKAFPMILKILDAFAYAHDRKMVHRDIKPSNIFVTNEGDIKILDFGIAQILSESQALVDIYSGTLEYMSPEQIKGEPLDVRSDIYSLGVVFYQMLTGKAPYDTTVMSHVDIKREVVNNPLKRMKTIYPYISDGAQNFVDHAMCKNPSGRFSDCHQMKKEIEKLSRKLESQNNGNKNNDTVKRDTEMGSNFLGSKPKKKSNLLLIISLIAVAIITAGGVLGYIYYVNNSEKAYADYIDKLGIVEGIKSPEKNNGTLNDHYRILMSGGKPVRLSYENSSGQVINIKDSLLSRYKYPDTEFIYDSDGRLDYKKIYDQDGILIFQVNFDNNPYEATVKDLRDNSGNGYKLIYDPASGRLSTVRYINKNGNDRMQRGVYGERYNYDNSGRLVRVTYLDDNNSPTQDDTGVGIISFEYKGGLSDVVSSLYDKSGKPVTKTASGRSSQGKKHRGEKADKSGKTKKNAKEFSFSNKNEKHIYR